MHLADIEPDAVVAPMNILCIPFIFDSTLASASGAFTA